MQTAHCLLSLGGDHGNTVMKYDVTAAEIAVLRAIHGDESVKDVEPAGDVKRPHRVERERLLGIYGMAKIPDTKVSVVETMFPGVAARVFETLQEIDLPESFYKATGHLTAQSSEPDEDAPETEPDAPAQATDEADETEDGVGEDIHDEHAENILG
jgi:hypothetical protein